MNLLKRPIWGRIAVVVTVLWMVVIYIFWDDWHSDARLLYLFPLVMLWGVVWIVRGDMKMFFEFIKSNRKFLVVAIFIALAAYKIIQIQSDVSSIQSDVSSIQSGVSSIESDISSIQSDVSSIESDVSSR